MAARNRRVVLAERPTGRVDEKTTRLEEADAPEPGEGEALLRNRYLSIGPTIRTWMDDREGYLPPIGIGEVVRSGGVAEVVRSNSDRFAPGDLVFGMTAYFGLLEVGRMEEGDTVVISGAAGATGSTVGQIARIKGASRVVGIAGSEEKCAWGVEELGFDAAINYKTEDVAARLREECPDGIDLYFDNVGGEILDAALGRLALRGRVVLCGAIAAYNEDGPPRGPANYVNLISRRGRMEGFIILDFIPRFPEAQAQMAAWIAEGKIQYATHVVEGLENAPDALNLLFTGGNTGKVIVKVA